MSDVKNLYQDVKNLYQRINAIRAAVSYVQKDKEVSTGRGSYRAVTHDMVTAMVRRHMIEHGVVCFPSLVASTMATLPAAEGKTQQFRYEATYDFTFANVDDQKDFVVVKIEAHAIDNADKAPGKAISYAKKYAILKLFEIETGEDEESRVPSFNVDEHIDKIMSASSIDLLKEVFKESLTIAINTKDVASQKILIRAKDLRKEALSRQAAPGQGAAE